MNTDDRTRFTRWYDRQSWPTLVLVGLSPLIAIAVILIVIIVAVTL